VVEEDKTQFEVFEESSASDPTHSMISKDHFDNILNEPAGRVAQVVVEHAVNLVVGAWSDPSRDIGRTLNEVRSIFYMSLPAI
jgi:Heterokaryon incompatibility protein Het-C